MVLIVLLFILVIANDPNKSKNDINKQAAVFLNMVKGDLFVLSFLTVKVSFLLEDTVFFKEFFCF